MTNDNNDFVTAQTPLAAYLITAGFTLKDIIYNDKLASFVFENDSERLKGCVDDFERLHAEANASILIRNYQELVKRIRKGF